MNLWRSLATWAAKSYIDDIVATAVDDASDRHKRHEARAIEDERLNIADALREAGYPQIALAVQTNEKIPEPEKVPLQNWKRATTRELPW